MQAWLNSDTVSRLSLLLFIFILKWTQHNVTRIAQCLNTGSLNGIRSKLSFIFDTQLVSAVNPSPPGRPHRRALLNFLACHVFNAYNVLLNDIHVVEVEHLSKMWCNDYIRDVYYESYFSVSQHLHWWQYCIDQITTLTVSRYVILTGRKT